MAYLLYGVVCTAVLAVLTAAKPTGSEEMAVELRMPEVQPKLVGGTPCHIGVNYLTKFHLTVDHPLWCHSIYQTRVKFDRNSLLHKAEKRQRKKMSQHLHVSLPSGTSYPHRNKICRSKIRLLSQLRTHD